MSELSNLSKTSLPSSIPTSNGVRHGSITSTTTSIKTASLLIQKQNGSNALNESKPAHINQSINKCQSSTPAKQNVQLYNQINSSLSALAASQTQEITAKKGSIHIENRTSLKKNGQSSLNQPITATPLSINTGVATNTTNIASCSLSTCSSPSSSTTGTIKSKIENKLNNEIKRLEALCESRTKELTVLKLKLRDTVMSFDAISVAFKYLANDVNYLFNYLIFWNDHLKLSLKSMLTKNIFS
jgi:hypothetical protein